MADVQAEAPVEQAVQLMTPLVEAEKKLAEQVKATVAELQVAIPVPHEVQTPAKRKYPALQEVGRGPVVQVAALTGQAKQAP